MKRSKVAININISSEVENKRIKREIKEEEDDDVQIVVPTDNEEQADNKLTLPISPGSRSNRSKFETRLLVSTRVAGAIIGRGGHNISRLCRENEAIIKVPSCPGPERVLTMQTRDLGSAVSLLRQILPSVADETRQGEDLEVRMLFHQSIIETLVGKVRKIRSTGVNSIKIYENCAPKSTERCLAIIGDQEKICTVAGLILDLASNAKIRGFSKLYDPINYYGAKYADEYGGYAVHTFPARLGKDPRRSNLSTGVLGLLTPDFKPIMTQLAISRSMAGAIIGPGGSRIKKIRNESMASIKIADEPEKGSNERIITIIGTEGQIQRAQYLLQKSVRDNMA